MLKNKKIDKSVNVFYAISLAWQLGFLIVFSIGGFLFLGYLLDEYFKTLPLFILVGLIVGLVITFYEVYHYLMPVIKNNQQQEDD